VNEARCRHLLQVRAGGGGAASSRSRPSRRNSASTAGKRVNTGLSRFVPHVERATRAPGAGSYEIFSTKNITVILLYVAWICCT
jgi:hypothetical protein